MEILVCPVDDCRKPFQVNRFDASINIGLVSGVVRCPHCGFEQRGDEASVYLTHALSKEEEAKLRAQCKEHA